MAVITTSELLPQQESSELYMLSKRDNVEKDRLDAQSQVINIVRGGHVLDPAIPKASIRRIADIATGTGVWLSEVSMELAGRNNLLETVGFDISADQFPKNARSENKFVVWDATKSFPVEYHNSFDVVHARLLTVAVTVEQLRDIARNVFELIKPGGYLQWTDWTYQNGHEIIYPSGDGELSLSSEGEEMYRFHGQQGFSYDTCGDVAEALKGLPMEIVNLTDHCHASYEMPEIRELVADWHSRVVPLFMETMSRRQGCDEDAAKARADKYRQKVIEMGRKGVVFVVPVKTLVGKKLA